MKRFFDEELDTLRSHLVLMAEKAIEQVRSAVKALVELDVELVRRVRQADDELDQLEIRIDEEAIRYVGLRGPVAGELRLVIVGMKASHDLERVGDEATNIAKRAVSLAAAGGRIRDSGEISRMTEIAVAMLRDAFDSFLEGDEAKAVAICRRDREVDEINRTIHRDLTAHLTAHPEDTVPVIELLFVSKSLERIADHATNIAEEVIYLMRGRDVRHTEEVKKKE